MSIFGNDILNESEVSENTISSLVEAFIIEDFNHTMTDEEKDEFIHSEDCKAMIESGLISEASLVYLDKGGDLNRRITLASLQLAKDKNDSLYQKLVFVADKRKTLLSQIRKKYGMAATKTSKIAQKELIKKMPTKFKKRITIH